MQQQFAPTTSIDPTTGRSTSPLLLQALAIALTSLAVLSLLLPLVEVPLDSFALSDAGGDVIVYVVLAIAALTTGALTGRRHDIGAGLIGGAALTVGALFADIVATSYNSIRTSQADDFDAGFGPAIFTLGVAVVSALLIVGLSLRHLLARGTQRAMPAGAALVGVAASLTTVVGAALPPSGAGVSVADRLLGLDPWYLDLTRTTFVVSFGLAGLLGFARRSSWGLGFATSGVVLSGWYMLASLGNEGIDEPGATGFVEEWHPLFFVGITAQIVALMVAWVPHLSAGTLRTSGSPAWTAIPPSHGESRPGHPGLPPPRPSGPAPF